MKYYASLQAFTHDYTQVHINIDRVEGQYILEYIRLYRVVLYNKKLSFDKFYPFPGYNTI